MVNWSYRRDILQNSCSYIYLEKENNHLNFQGFLFHTVPLPVSLQGLSALKEDFLSCCCSQGLFLFSVLDLKSHWREVYFVYVML